MAAMKAAADEIITQADRRETPDGFAFRTSAIHIYCAMGPKFGPANAWLYNERSQKVELLAKTMGFDRDTVEQLDETFYDEACSHLEHIVLILNELGYETTVRPSDRRELLWTFAEGFALSIVDTSQRVPWIPAYSDPSTAPPGRLAHPRLTLYLYPPYAGRAEQHLARREQPGVPVFYTGAIIGFTLLPAQSGDVDATAIYDKVMPALKAEGLFFRSSSQEADTFKDSVNANPQSGGIRNGLPWIIGPTEDPSPKLPPLGGRPLLWSHGNGAMLVHRLITP